MTSRPATSAGFTLLELMLTITVAAVIMGLAIPNMQQFMWNNRMTAAANDMVIAITTARSEAIKNRAQVVVCLSSNPAAATPDCAGNGTQGWVVFIDTDKNGVPGAGETVSLRHAALPATLSVRMKPATNDRYIAFAASGFSKAVGAKVPLESVVVCDHRGNVALYGSTQSTARTVMVGTTGRARVSRLISEIATEGGCP